MAYDFTKLALVQQVGITGETTVWSYTSNDDALSVIQGGGYFNPDLDESSENLTSLLKLYDFIMARGDDGCAVLYIVSVNPYVAADITDVSMDLGYGKMYIGNSSNHPTELTVSGNGHIIIGNGTTATTHAVTGDITLSNSGVTAIASGVIVNADVNASAAIAFSKLAALPSTQILVGSAGSVATAVTVTGDVTIGNTGVTAIASGVIVNADINASAAIDFSKLATLSSGNILVGSVSNVATSVAMTGDITISNAGVTAIGSGVIVNADINASAAIDYSKLATLTSGNILVGSAGNVATSVAMTGDVTISNSGVTSIGSGVIVNADINASAAIDFSKLATLSSGNILVGSAGNVAASVAVTGDIAISNAGVASISSGVIVNADVNASAAIDFSKLATLSSANILVGSAGNVATSVALSGDATISNAGALTIANSAVTNAKILNSTIAGAKLSSKAGYFTVTTATNGTTPVNVFGVGGAPCALTITNVFITALDANAGNITVQQAGNTVCTIAKGVVASVMLGAISLSNTVYAASDVCTVLSSAASGNAFVTIVFTVA